MDSKSNFNRVASLWDEMRIIFFSTMIRDSALGIAEIQKGCRAVDLGAGTGFITEALVGAGANVIAVDQSEKMLQELNQKFVSTASVDPRLGDAEHLPVSDQSIDRVFANMYLHHVEHPGLAIKESKRILKPRGRLVITDLEKHDYQFLKKEHHDRWPGFYRSDIRHWLKMAGFSNIIIGTAPGERWCVMSSCKRKTYEFNIFLATGTA
jgi:ubiquinone/menaquinone biosynthesis C-methylase UbiE